MSAHQATRCTRCAASSISQPCPSASEPRDVAPSWRSTCAASSRCRYGPSTCCECAAARGPDDATHASHGRSSAGRRAQTTPCGRAQWARWARSGRRRRCARVGSSTRAQAVAHGAPEAFSAHSQAQLWRRDATSRPMPQLSPEDFLADREHVDELRREQPQAAAAPRAHADPELAGPRHAATRTVLRAPAGSREPSPSRGVPSSSQRRCTPAAAAAAAAAVAAAAPRRRRRPEAASNPQPKKHWPTRGKLLQPPRKAKNHTPRAVGGPKYEF
jgi:hypothetical protein